MAENQVKFGKKTFVNFNTRSIRDCYEVLSKLGKGGYGTVYQVKNKTTGGLFACKKLSKLSIQDQEKFMREIKILIKTDHPNIIKLYDIFESANSLYLIMEQCNGGELFDKITLLKPENLLYLKKGDEKNNPLKVIDFGLSQTLDTKKILSSRVGTAYYVSPEILAGKYNEKCDIWSAGVILYVLLSGEPPFNGPSDAVIYSKIKKMKFNFPPEKWGKISKEAKDLISHMIVKEEERYNASQVLAHPWFKIAKEKISLEKLNFDSQFFKQYKEMNQLKKMVLVYIASRLQENEISDLKLIFQAFDTDNDGQINYKEFEQGILQSKSASIKPDEIKAYFDSIDTDKNGKIEYTEFISACLQNKIKIKEEKLYDAFSAFDKDHNGKITKEELCKVLKLESSNSSYVSELIKMADKSGDEEIDYKEFLSFMGFKK